MAHNLNVPYFQPTRTGNTKLNRKNRANLSIYRQRRKNGKHLKLILSDRCTSILLNYELYLVKIPNLIFLIRNRSKSKGRDE